MSSFLRRATLILIGTASAAGLYAICSPHSTGPDVTVAELIDLGKYTDDGPIGGLHAFAVGTESLNRGDADIHWVSGSNMHPVIAQNLYRYERDEVDRPAGRFEQVGMSWLKHGFTALAGQEFCGSCTFEPQHSSGLWLGMGCEDPYWAGLNGSQWNLGPRSEVNATSGLFTWPIQNNGSGDATLQKRMLVAAADLADNAGDPDLRYFAEGQYIAYDDAQAGNGLNNATYREVVVSGDSNLAFGGPLGTYPGQQMQEAIRAWKAIDPEVEITSADYEENFLPARFNLAAKAHDNGDGTWRYEYALHNLNSHRSAQAFSVPLDGETAVTGPGMHDIDHHSGEPFDTASWDSAVDAASISWATALYANNPNANALRWGTLFNFWFDADAPPGSGTATITLFRPGGMGEPLALEVPTIVPGGTECLLCDGFESGDTLGWTS